jgi:aminoglycoside phosphotransferase family enzyme
VDSEHIELATKVHWLSQPETFAERPSRVERIETHFAWLFLTGRFVYKMKKPQRFRGFDLSMLAARHANCELEVALNRRLAADVYIGTVPLCADDAKPQLGGSGTPVEWLVKMHQLPRDETLERAAAAGELREVDLEALLRKLAQFYAGAARAPWDGPAYRQWLAREISHYAAELVAPNLGLDAGRVRAVKALLLGFLAAHPDLFAARVAEGRIVDAHGDLRPEHVFLLPDPQIIDCLEFSAELRLLDSAAELAFLALECVRLGHSALGPHVLELYRRLCHDDVDAGLLRFYTAERALVRALLAAWHLQDDVPSDAATHWRSRARWYLHVAATQVGDA